MAGADHVGELCLPLIPGNQNVKQVENEKLKKVKVKISGILTSRMTLESPWGVCADSRVPQRSPWFHCSLLREANDSSHFNDSQLNTSYCQDSK